MSDFKKKVTKIIRKDGISYRQAGGSQISYDPNEDTATKEVQEKKRLGKVIKRADGSTIVVVDGKIVKTMKPEVPALSSVKDVTETIIKSNVNSPSVINISADELSPDELTIGELSTKSTDNLLTNQPTLQDVKNSVEIKRTITFDRSQPDSNLPFLINSGKPVSYKDTKDTTKDKKYDSSALNKRDDRSLSKDIKAVSLQQSYLSKKSTISPEIDKMADFLPRTKEESAPMLSKYGKGGNQEESSRTFRSSKRTRSPKQSPHRSPQRSYTKIPKRSRSPLIQRNYPHGAKSQRHRKYDNRSQRSGTSKQTQPKLTPTKDPKLDSLLSSNEFGSKEDIINLIQKQAEEMLQAQNVDPIDAEKRKKLREAMESILTKRGLIEPLVSKENISNDLYEGSSDSSDGCESSPILEKLHRKYNNISERHEEIESYQKEPQTMESKIPCIDNISVASDEQKISDVSHSDMELSDEEPKEDNEDGKTPAFRKNMYSIPSHDAGRPPSPQRIQIKFGKDAEEDAFQELASRLNDLKNSEDVQSLIEAIENKIKSLLTINLEPSSLEKKIKRYQTLVAKVVIKAELIKEKEEEDIITYHRYTKSKDADLVELQKRDGGKPSVSYPVQINEEIKPWLYTKQNNPIQDHPIASSQPINLQVESQSHDPYQKVKEHYVSQRPGYHVCLLCMIESNNESQFMKHLNGKKHMEAVNNKIKQMDTPINNKKYKKHTGLVIRCKLCDVTCVGQKKYNDHANHRSHQALVQAYVKIGRVVPEPEIIHDHEDQIRERIEEIQDSGTPAVGREYMSVKSIHDCDDNIIDVYHCSLCKSNCNSEVQVEKHVRSKKHYLYYVKSTQPDVNIQVNAGEHKKRRETTKKMVSTMKTIKQMEEEVERNKVVQRQEYDYVITEEKNVPGLSNYSGPRSTAITNHPITSSIEPTQGFQLGAGRKPSQRNLYPPTEIDHQPKYPPAVTRFQKEDQVQPEIFSSTAPQASFSGPMKTQDQLLSNKKKIYSWEIDNEPKQLEPHQASKSTFKALQDFKKSYSSSSNRDEHSSKNMQYSAPFPSAPASKLAKISQKTFVYDPSNSLKHSSTNFSNLDKGSSQSGTSNEHIMHYPEDQYSSSLSSTNRQGNDRLPNRSDSSFSSQKQSFNQPTHGPTCHSYSSSAGNQNSDIHISHPQYDNIHHSTVQVKNYPSQKRDVDYQLQTSSSSSAALQNNTRGTYSSVYNNLKKGSDQPVTFSSENQQSGQSVYSGKATYSGVYTNIQRK